MRRRSVAGIVLLGMACGGRAEPVGDAERARIAGDVRAAAQGLVAGLNRLDPAPFAAQLDTSADFRYVENGVLYPSRDSVLAVARAALGSLTSFSETWDTLSVAVLGRDAAAVIGTWRGVAVDTEGHTLAFTGAWSAAYARRGDAWVIVQAHDSYTPVPPGQ